VCGLDADILGNLAVPALTVGQQDGLTTVAQATVGGSFESNFKLLTLELAQGQGNHRGILLYSTGRISVATGQSYLLLE
jgi:hypothetical protein